MLTWINNISINQTMQPYFTDLQKLLFKFQIK